MSYMDKSNFIRSFKTFYLVKYYAVAYFKTAFASDTGMIVLYESECGKRTYKIKSASARFVYDKYRYNISSFMEFGENFKEFEPSVTKVQTNDFRQTNKIIKNLYS